MLGKLDIHLGLFFSTKENIGPMSPLSVVLCVLEKGRWGQSVAILLTL